MSLHEDKGIVNTKMITGSCRRIIFEASKSCCVFGEMNQEETPGLFIISVHCISTFFETPYTCIFSGDPCYNQTIEAKNELHYHTGHRTSPHVYERICMMAFC